VKPALTSAPSQREQPPAETSLEDVMPLLVEHDGPIAVVDGTGAALGYVDRAAIIKALSQGE